MWLSTYYNLGDMLTDVDYVSQRCREGRELHSSVAWKSRQVSEQVDSSDRVHSQEQATEDDADEYEYVEVEVVQNSITNTYRFCTMPVST